MVFHFYLSELRIFLVVVDFVSRLIEILESKEIALESLEVKHERLFALCRCLK